MSTPWELWKRFFFYGKVCCFFQKNTTTLLITNIQSKQQDIFLITCQIIRIKNGNWQIGFHSISEFHSLSTTHLIWCRIGIRFFASIGLVVAGNLNSLHFNNSRLSVVLVTSQKLRARGLQVFSARRYLFHWLHCYTVTQFYDFMQHRLWGLYSIW